MPIEFKLPELAENITSADVADVTVQEGEEIEAGQVVLELETEKAVMPLQCPHAGKVTKVLVKQGETVQVGQPVLMIEVSEAKPAEEKPSGGKPSAHPPEGEKAVQESSARQTQPEVAAADQQEVSAEEERGMKRAAATAPRRTPAAAEHDRGNGDMPLPAGPATRRLARELGVPLEQLSGSGPGGRITQEDVARAYAGRNGAAGPMAAPPLPDFTQFGEVERQPLSKLARTSAANLSLSWQMIPHVTQHDLADVTELEAARKQFGQTASKEAPKVTMTAIAMKAAAAALKEFPQFNASLDSAKNELVLKRYYHIGVAVDTPYGLVVPVIRDVDRKTVMDLASELTEVAEKARNRKLELKEMQGGTFTITNLGGIGGTAFTPIVNYPEVAILGMSRSRLQMEWNDGEPEPRLMLPLSLSYDHRVVNGADAARFITRLSQMFSDPFKLLIEF